MGDMQMNDMANGAMVIARERVKALGLDPEKYEIEMTEEPTAFVVRLIGRNKPDGFRGAMAGLAEPVFRVDKTSGAIVDQHFAR